MMSEKTSRARFEAHMVKTFGKGTNLNREAEWVDENTTTDLIYLSENIGFAWHGWQASEAIHTKQIEELEAQIKVMRDALKPFADFAPHYPKERTFGNRVRAGVIYEVSSGDIGSAEITVEDFRAAQQAIATTDKG